MGGCVLGQVGVLAAGLEVAHLGGEGLVHHVDRFGSPVVLVVVLVMMLVMMVFLAVLVVRGAPGGRAGR